MSGWLIADWLGVVLGLAIAVVVEILFSSVSGDLMATGR
jgi:hypothetical protein